MSLLDASKRAASLLRSLYEIPSIDEGGEWDQQRTKHLIEVMRELEIAVYETRCAQLWYTPSGSQTLRCTQHKEHEGKCTFGKWREFADAAMR